MSASGKSAPASGGVRRLSGFRRWRGPYPILLSLLLGVLIWGYVDSRRMVVEEFEVPLQIQIPVGWEMQQAPAEVVKVQARGSRQVMRTIRSGRERRYSGLYILQSIEVPPASADTYTARFVLEGSQVQGLPGEVVVLGLQPAEFELHLARLVKRWVPVEPTIVGKPDMGYTVGLVQTDPKGVEVIEPKHLIDKLTPSDVLKTAPVDISGKRYGASDRVGLQPLMKSGEIIRAPGTVYVSVELVEIPSERTLEEKVAVRILMGWPPRPMQGVKLQPPSVQVTVAGPELIVTKLSASDVTVYVDVKAMVPKDDEVYTIKCRSLVPEGVEVVKIEPDTVEWRVTPETGKAEAKETSAEATQEPAKKP